MNLNKFRISNLIENNFPVLKQNDDESNRVPEKGKDCSPQKVTNHLPDINRRSSKGPPSKQRLKLTCYHAFTVSQMLSRYTKALTRCPLCAAKML